MADANAPQLGKVVGLGDQDVAAPPVGAPPSDGQPFLAVCPPAPDHSVEKDEANPADKSVDKPIAPAEGDMLNGGLGRKASLGKPVEVMSVPETPVNGSTPAGGTPRPELQIFEDPAPPAPNPPADPAIEPIVMTGVEEPKSTPATSQPDENTEEIMIGVPKTAADDSKAASTTNPVAEPSGTKAPELAVDQPVNGAMDVDKPDAKPSVPVTHTGPESESVPAPAPAPPAEPVAAPPPAIPEAPPAAAIAPSVSAPVVEPAKSSDLTDASVGEKRKLEGEADAKVDAGPASVHPPTENQAATGSLPLDKKAKLDVTVTTSNGSDTGNNSKKEKKLPAVGRTQRKTRSQGPVDV